MRGTIFEEIKRGEGGVLFFALICVECELWWDDWTSKWLVDCDIRKDAEYCEEYDPTVHGIIDADETKVIKMIKIELTGRQSDLIFDVLADAVDGNLGILRQNKKEAEELLKIIRDAGAESAQAYYRREEKLRRDTA